MDKRANNRLKQIQVAIEEENKIVKKEREKYQHEIKSIKEYYEKNLSRAAREKKISQYISSKTVNGEDIVDPLRKEVRIYPSKVMVVKDNKFGLGRLHEQNELLLLRMIEKYPYETFDSSAVPKMMAESKIKPKKEKRKILDFDEESEEELGEYEYKGLWE